MRYRFGLLPRLNFLQDLASVFIANIIPEVIHNLEKYMAIKKVHHLSAIEEIKGDYLEFGVFTGSSFCHSIRCVKKDTKIYSSISSTRFYGFDSFQGFGELPDSDKHPTYKDENFGSSYEKVDSRVRRTAKEMDYQLIKGFFSETLAPGAESYGIKKSRIIFIDSDTYTSAIDALLFVLPTIQEGSYIILDDYFSYKGNQSLGVARAFTEFIDQGKLSVRHVLNYGMGGVAFVVSGVK